MWASCLVLQHRPHSTRKKQGRNPTLRRNSGHVFRARACFQEGPCAENVCQCTGQHLCSWQCWKNFRGLRAATSKNSETAAMLEPAAALKQQALPRMVTIPARYVLEHVNMSVQHNHYQAPAAWPPAGLSMLMALTFGQKASGLGIH